jgi:NADH-quinone oxidoreductase subunit E
MDTTVDQIVAKYNRNPAHLIAMLQDLQAAKRYLPREDMKSLAGALAVPLTRVYRVATFFKAFSLTPKGRHIINVCVGTACHVRGAARVLGELERMLGIAAGETDAEQEFSLETVNCLGACALGPVVVVDETYHGDMTPGKVSALVDECRGK